MVLCGNNHQHHSVIPWRAPKVFNWLKTWEKLWMFLGNKPTRLLTWWNAERKTRAIRSSSKQPMALKIFVWLLSFLLLISVTVERFGTSSKIAACERKEVIKPNLRIFVQSWNVWFRVFLDWVTWQNSLDGSDLLTRIRSLFWCLVLVLVPVPCRLVVQLRAIISRFQSTLSPVQRMLNERKLEVPWHSS